MNRRPVLKARQGVHEKVDSRSKLSNVHHVRPGSKNVDALAALWASIV